MTTNPIITVDENGLPSGFVDLEQISRTADEIARNIVAAACVEDDLEKAERVIVAHFDQSSATSEMVAISTIHLLAIALRELAGVIRNPEGANR